MWEFIKVQIGSILGSAVDFLITILCTELGFSWYLLSNLLGNCAGGSIQFLLSRRWIFKESKTGVPVQLFKYLIFFLGNLLLSALGVYALTQFLHINYIVSKLICSVFLGLSYNYYVQKHFVFA
jgi:putative flippase GtrA